MRLRLGCASLLLLALVLAAGGCSSDDAGSSDDPNRPGPIPIGGGNRRDGGVPSGDSGVSVGGGGRSGAGGSSGSTSGRGGSSGSAGSGAGGSSGASPGSGGADGGSSGADGGSSGASAGSGGASSECASEHEYPHTSEPAAHVTNPLPASQYNSRPPSSGPHCGVWGQYGIYDAQSPLPACNFLHNLEHGAIVVLYNCPDGCDDLVMEIVQLLNEVPDDPDCGIQRLILTPYAEMDTTIAAAAWGYTWTADESCFDDAARASLLAFIDAHWGSNGDAPESQLCADGTVP